MPSLRRYGSDQAELCQAGLVPRNPLESEAFIIGQPIVKAIVLPVRRRGFIAVIRGRAIASIIVLTLTFDKSFVLLILASVVAINVFFAVREFGVGLVVIFLRGRGFTCCPEIRGRVAGLSGGDVRSHYGSRLGG